MSFKKLATAVAIVSALSVGSASAANILTFGQVGNGQTVSATNNGAGSTTIVINNVSVTITQILAGVATPVNAFLTLTATSTGAASVVAGNVVQDFQGSFSITNGATNYLSGSFTDAVFGSGSSLTLQASTPGEVVNFNSNVIAAANLGLERALAFSFANVTPQAGIVNGSIASFTSSVSGVFSANVGQQVPEPASLLLLGSGLAGLAARARRRRQNA